MNDSVTGMLDKKTNTFYVLESGPVNSSYAVVDRIRSILIKRGVLKYSEQKPSEQPQVATYGEVKERANLKVETIYASKNVKINAEKKAVEDQSSPWKS